MRQHAKLIAAGLLLAAPLLAQATEVTLTVTGQITNKYVEADGASAMSALQNGQAVTLAYTFNTDQMPWNPENAYSIEPGVGFVDHFDQIIGGRFGSEDGQHGFITTKLAVTAAGIDYTQTGPSNEGSRFVRIRQPDQLTDGQGSFLDFHIANDAVRFGTDAATGREYDSFVSFSQATGQDWKETNLGTLLTTFNYAGSEYSDGRFYMFDAGCAQNRGQCGYAEFSLQSVTVASVPEPTTWATMGLGMLGVAGAALARRRRERQQQD